MVNNRKKGHVIWGILVVLILVVTVTFFGISKLKVNTNTNSAQTYSSNDIDKTLNKESNESKVENSNNNQSNTIKKYDDVRVDNIFNSKKINKLDLSEQGDIIKTLRFNEKTKWPDSSKMPVDVNPKELMEIAKNPGLGIKDIHKTGLTGKGVNVAIIDQPMYLDHPEFKGKIVKYKNIGCTTKSSMHGPAVTSILVGEQIGTAPDAKVYYVAVPSWSKDAEYYSKALDWIIEENRKLSDNEKIRVVSVSAAPSGLRTPFTKNNELWDYSVTQAEEEGILVLDCTEHHRYVSGCYYDLSDIDNVSKCEPGYPGIPLIENISDFILVPTSRRTTAEEYKKGDFSYQYSGRAGLSWGIPYCAGLLALGWQERPELTSKEMIDFLFTSAYKKDNYRIINPKEFIKQVKEYKTKNKGGYIMPVLFLCTGLFLLLLGIVIWRYVLVGIIAGYDEKKTEDKRGLAKWVGSNLVIMGSLSILISVFTVLIKEMKGIYPLSAFMIIIIAFCIRAAVGCKRYEQ